MLLCLVGTPSGVAKENTNDTIIVTAMATDQDTNDTLIYTLWYGISADSITTKGVSSDTTRSGTSVTLTQTGLNNNTTYYFTVTVTDSKLYVEEMLVVVVDIITNLVLIVLRLEKLLVHLVTVEVQ